jgi:hypothetical protein
MSEVTINYKGSPIATMDASGLRTLLTQGKYLEDDIEIVYQRPSQSAPNLQVRNKTYTPTESQQTEQVRADNGYDGLDEVNVTVQPVSSSYVGSGIDRRDSTDLTQSGATVEAPAGYYEQAAAKTIPNATRSNAITIDGNGLIKNTHNILTGGYLPAGSVEYTRQLTVQAAQAIHPSASDQQVASGRYLTGAQTIKAVLLTNLLASIIKKDEVVKIGDDTDDDCVASITGTYEASGGGGGAAQIDTKTMTNSSDQNTSISFTGLSGQPIAFFVRLTSSVSRSSSYRYYYVENVRYDGTNTNGRYFYRYNGTLTNDTSHYSFTYANGTLTISSSASRSAAGGSFYNGSYELVYIY